MKSLKRKSSLLTFLQYYKNIDKDKQHTTHENDLDTNNKGKK